MRHRRDTPCVEKQTLQTKTPLRAVNDITIDSSTYLELSNYQLKLYHDLYRVHETSVQLQHIAERHPFLRGSIEQVQQLLLASQLEIQDKLRNNEQALQATAA
jgi:hypothetical protein